MGYEIWNGIHCHKMHRNYAKNDIVPVHFMTMTSKNSDLLHMSHFKTYLDFYDIKCRIWNEFGNRVILDNTSINRYMAGIVTDILPMLITY